MLIRHLDQALTGHFVKYKEVLVLLGARQVGKTTILRRLFPDAQYLSVDVEAIRSALERYDPAVYRGLLDKKGKFVIIDEIHRVGDPGRAAKIFYDLLPQYRLIIAGSSSFRIKNKASESLAGRKIDYYLYPLTFSEYLVQQGIEKEFSFGFMDSLITGKKTSLPTKAYDWKTVLNNVLVFGLYPAMLAYSSNATYLLNLVDSVVFRDLMELSLLENKSAALALLKLLAYQIGSLVNYSELASKLGISTKTVQRYIDLFEQSYIIFSIKPFTTRKRDEIAKMPKIYFYDLGLRNALINNFEPVEVRGDAGQLFENFIVTEIVKYNYYGNYGFNFNFWRTKSGSEIDLVLSKTSSEPLAIEIKSRPRRLNQAFKSRYPDSRTIVISKDNFFV